MPKFHKRIGPWLSGLAPDADPKQEDLMALGPTRVPGRAGDMVIWQFSCVPWPPFRALRSSRDHHRSISKRWWW